MQEELSNTKRIAKNSLFLYLRMFLVMGVSLFTTRVVLKTLGVDDFGIYNVVGGIVSMFAFLSGTISSAAQRFFAIEIGKGNEVKLNQLFCVTMLIFFGLSIIIVLLAETVGLWFLHAKMNIPVNRLSAANWVYQFSILSFVVTILMIPYNAAVIAQEDMKFFAKNSVVEVVLKLLVVYLLCAFDADKLKVYAVLIFLVHFGVNILYYVFCRKHYSSYRLHFFWNKHYFQEMFSFAGWNTVGALANILRSQGINVLLSMFFNPAVNAARAVAYQVNSAITNFVNNFYTAVRPQIFKKYSSGDVSGMHNLVLVSSRYAFFLMLLIAGPLFNEAEYWLSLWLKNVPERTVLFTRLVIVNALLEVFSAPLVNAIQATGKIRLFQSIVSVIYLLNIPISYLFLKKGCSPQYVMYVNIALVCVSFAPRLLICKKAVGLSVCTYMKDVLLKSVIGAVVFFAATMGQKKMVDFGGLANTFVAVGIGVIVVLFICMKKDEIVVVKKFIREKIC